MKTAVITGASKGIGADTAILLAKSGDYDCIAITCHTDKASLDSVENSIRAASKCDVVKGIFNIGNNEAVHDFINGLLSTGCEISLLVNNAAVSHVGLFSEMSFDDFKYTSDTNITSLYSTCHAVLPDMIHRKSGRIINISSVWGLVGGSCEVAYSATKGAVNSFTRALAKELAPSGISVNAIAFGYVETSMNGNLSEEEKQSLFDEIPIGRALTTIEAADMILRISRMPFTYTGDIIKYDGAWI